MTILKQSKTAASMHKVLQLSSREQMRYNIEGKADMMNNIVRVEKYISRYYDQINIDTLRNICISNNKGLLLECNI